MKIGGRKQMAKLRFFPHVMIVSWKTQENRSKIKTIKNKITQYGG